MGRWSSDTPSTGVAAQNLTVDKAQLLEKEYFHLRDVIESFDQRALTIKGWSVAVGAALGALTRERTWGLVAAAISSVVFWILELYWRSFKHVFVMRAELLEQFFAGGSQPVPLQIQTHWDKEWKTNGRKQMIRMSWWLHVCFPHVVVLVIAVGLLLVLND